MPVAPPLRPPKGPPTQSRSSVTRRAALSALVLAALVAVATSDPLHHVLTAAIEAVEPVLSTRPGWGAALFVLLAAFSAVLAFVSSSALVPVAVAVWGPAGTAALLWTGWTVGGVGSYAVGRWLGRPVVARLDRHGSAERWLGRLRPDTPLWVVALLQLGLQSELSGALLGMARYPLPRYLTALVVVEAAFAGLAVAVGTGLVERQPGLLVGAGAAFVGAGVAALAVLHRRLAPP